MLRTDRVQTNPQEDYLQYHNDGLLDIIIGVGIFTIGLVFFMDISIVFAAILPAILMPVWQDAKKRFTAPRMKYIQFTEAERVAAKTKAMLVGLLLAGILTFTSVVFFTMFLARSNGLMPIWLQTFFKEFFWLVLGVFGAGILSALARLYKLNRFYIYAFIMMAILTLSYALGVSFWLTLALTGGVITTTGLVVLQRFIQAYPIEKHI